MIEARMAETAAPSFQVRSRVAPAIVGGERDPAFSEGDRAHKRPGQAMAAPWLFSAGGEIRPTRQVAWGPRLTPPLHREPK